jgi:hypothetical protein
MQDDDDDDDDGGDGDSENAAVYHNIDHRALYEANKAMDARDINSTRERNRKRSAPAFESVVDAVELRAQSMLYNDMVISCECAPTSSCKCTFETEINGTTYCMRLLCCHGFLWYIYLQQYIC